MDISDRVNTREKLIQYIVDGGGDFERETFSRYDFELYDQSKGKIVTSRLGRLDGNFSIQFIVQKDVSGNDGKLYQEADWTDDGNWIPYVRGSIKGIREIITEQVYRDIAVVMKEIMVKLKI